MSPPIMFATTNPNKVNEVRAMLQPLGIELSALPKDSDIPEPDEDGETFLQNATIKATAYAAATGQLCLAEDSGLEVDALGGAPGVHSARYAGIGSTRVERDNANNAKLLEAMRDASAGQRGARFVCVMVLARPDGSVVTSTRGTFEGVIAHAARGQNGFGYDPLLMLPEGKTSAELTPEEKNARSHRGQALRALVDWLQSEAGRSALDESSD